MICQQLFSAKKSRIPTEIFLKNHYLVSRDEICRAFDGAGQWRTSDLIRNSFGQSNDSIDDHFPHHFFEGTTVRVGAGTFRSSWKTADSK